MRRKPLLIVGALLVAGLVRADPLDNVTGTEDWAKAGPENIEAEWQDWYRGRVSQRKAARELRVQRVISQRLARLLLKADDPTFEEIRRVLQAGMKAVAGGEASPDPARLKPRRSPRPRPRPAPPTDEPPAEGTEADAPTYSNVPVERLDNMGQAIDEEGDRELQRLSKKRAPRPPTKKKP